MDDSEPDFVPQDAKSETDQDTDTTDFVPQDAKSETDQDTDTTDFGWIKFGKKKLKKDDKMEREPVSVPGGAHVYDMTNKRRGIALIICNSYFSKMPMRKGATKDASRIHQTLASLGFEPHVLTNQTSDQMVFNLEKVSKQDHGDTDCFLCVLMSHGDRDGIYGSDGKPVSVKNITSLFKGDKCRSLAGKPKLFFIQACRGRLLDSGVQVEVADGPLGFRKTKKMIASVPTTADFLISQSTADEHFAFLNKKNGSVYIQSLADELTQCDGSVEICTVLQRVARKVAFEFVSNTVEAEYHKKKQCPVYTSSLTKQLYLDKSQKKP
ncbi:caspase-3-like [Liolophura sinensis]|uniref:caspase-3-like n=1 Tax=Liolophura sinensis TaxID=3198878 RepID=UPI0031588B80